MDKGFHTGTSLGEDWFQAERKQRKSQPMQAITKVTSTKLWTQPTYTNHYQTD